MSNKSKPKIKAIFKESFLEGDSYHSRAYPELTSTVYKMRYSHYCIHCNNEALPVQGLIDRFDDYSNTGFRCNCDEAMLEMVEELAHAMGKFNHVKPINPHHVDRAAYIEHITNNLDKRDLPLNGDMNALSNLKITILKPEKQLYLEFWGEHKKEISFYLRDPYYKFKDIYLFMTKVKERLDELKTEEENEILKLLKINSEKDFDFFVKK